MSSEKYRLVTRSDFDGLVCAAILKEQGLIDEIKFVHPKDMQDGVIDITSRDITTNLPFVEGVFLAFDHHESESIRVGKKDNHIIDPKAPSAARVVYNYYGGKAKMPRIPVDLMEAVDKGDSAQFNKVEVLIAQGWDLMNFIMDARTGLGRFREFTISNYQLMMELIDKCVEMPVDDILMLPDVVERVDLYVEHEAKAREQIQRCSTTQGNIVMLDLRDEDTIWACNRFLIYALFPDQNISIHVMWGLKKQNTVFAIGKSIFDRSSKTNVGELCLKYGGGGHQAAGTCQVPNDQAEETLQALIDKMNSDG
ncbi:MAG TPA: exopolyphosphatase [Rhodospirillaceae bacterium]|nr:exopolyphosphatase [Rhodospirillaceae bacterium]